MSFRPFATAFYYAGQAGLSIGFGAPYETDDESKLFTIFFVLCGSSFICASLALFVGSALDDQVHRVMSVNRVIYRLLASLSLSLSLSLTGVPLCAVNLWLLMKMRMSVTYDDVFVPQTEKWERTIREQRGLVNSKQEELKGFWVRNKDLAIMLTLFSICICSGAYTSLSILLSQSFSLCIYIYNI